MAPPAFAARVHCRASRLDGAKIAGSSRPSPHSRSVNVLTPKCRKSASSSRCHASCDADGRGRASVTAFGRCGRAHPTMEEIVTPTNERRFMTRDPWLLTYAADAPRLESPGITNKCAGAGIFAIFTMRAVDRFPSDGRMDQRHDPDATRSLLSPQRLPGRRPQLLWQTSRQDPAQSESFELTRRRVIPD